MKIHPKFLLNVAGGLTVAILLSLAVSRAALWSIDRTNQANQLAQRTLETINLLKSLLSNIQDAERGPLGYLLTNDRTDLEPYISASISLKQEIALLKNLMTNNPSQQDRLAKLESLLQERIDRLQEVIDLKQKAGLGAALEKIRSHQSMTVMKQIRRLLQEMEAVETGTLLQRQKNAANNAQSAKMASASVILLNLVIFTWLYQLIDSEVKKRNQAEQEVKHLNEDLENRVIERTRQFEEAIRDLQRTQGQLIQAEKMSSLGQLVAGVAHEINNPVSFIYGNLTPANEYFQDLLSLLALYQQHYPNPTAEIQNKREEIDLDFLQEDLRKLLSSMKMGADRIEKIVLSLRNFSRMDEAEVKAVDIHEGIENTLLILQNRLKAKPEHPEIEVRKNYSQLPLVECSAGQLNQVFMNILANAIDALEEINVKRTYQEMEENPSRITIRTSAINDQWVEIAIADNGVGMPKEVCQRICDPFFTTKPIGKGTGMGMSISYQIITEKHGGKLECFSNPGEGTEFLIQIPIRHNLA